MSPELIRKRVRRGSFCVDDLENAHSRNCWRYETRILSDSYGPRRRSNYCPPNLRRPQLERAPTKDFVNERIGVLAIQELCNLPGFEEDEEQFILKLGLRY